jgi:flavin reductase (DIM6/NTAB) family NADH-FMN oxidoreductase RutF
VDPQVFRQVISHFTSGVTVITTREQNTNYGLTASAVTSLTLEPPMLLVCINKNTGTQAAISRSRVFGVNILDENQADLAYKLMPYQMLCNGT